jgi:hypothetical protein
MEGDGMKLPGLTLPEALLAVVGGVLGGSFIGAPIIIGLVRILEQRRRP